MEEINGRVVKIIAAANGFIVNDMPSDRAGREFMKTSVFTDYDSLFKYIKEAMSKEVKSK